MSNNKTRKIRGGGPATNSAIFIFGTNQISTQYNTDPNFVEKGIIHVTDSDAIGSLRAMGTDFANIFGAKGFDNSIIDSEIFIEVRNNLLKAKVVKLPFA